MTECDIDWESWALGMCTLLDLAELADDMDEVQRICKMRFKLAEEHGVTVEICEPASPDNVIQLFR